MRLSTAKDKVLRAYVLSEPISRLRLDRASLMAALVDLAEEKYITILETSISGTGYLRTYSFQSVLPKGAHFIHNKKSFRKKAIWEYVENLPRRWGFIVLILGLIATNIWQFVNYRKDINRQPIHQNVVTKDTLIKSNKKN